jgi:hypothetical protein
MFFLDLLVSVSCTDDAVKVSSLRRLTASEILPEGREHSEHGPNWHGTQRADWKVDFINTVRRKEKTWKNYVGPGRNVYDGSTWKKGKTKSNK